MIEHSAISYARDRYAHLARFIPREVATGFLARMQADLARQDVGCDKLMKPGPLLKQPATEIYGYHYPPLAMIHWGTIPAIEALAGEALLPSYSYFRLYRQGDICRVRSDRMACERSLSLTLAYSDDRPWALNVSPMRTEKPYARSDDAFSLAERAQSMAMDAGDAVLYQGVHHHHGRTMPNPNAWSAHLFLYWVSRDGPYAAEAFDKQVPPDRVML